jgi:hypothetical protein
MLGAHASDKNTQIGERRLRRTIGLTLKPGETGNLKLQSDGSVATEDF